MDDYLHEKYLETFLGLLDEEKISYVAGPLEDRNLPQILLPPFEA